MKSTRTWILCANRHHAELFRFDEALGKVTRVIRIPCSGENFTRDLAREVEFACGYGTREKIILCGEFRLVNELCLHLDPVIREHIGGIVARDLVGETEETIRAAAGSGSRAA